MDTYEVKQVFEGFAELNNISEEEENRFKNLVDDMDDLDEGVDTVTSTSEVRELIGRVRDMLIDDLELENGSDDYIKVVSNLNELIELLRPEQEKKEMERMREEDARAELGI